MFGFFVYSRSSARQRFRCFAHPGPLWTTWPRWRLGPHESIRKPKKANTGTCCPSESIRKPKKANTGTCCPGEDPVHPRFSDELGLALAGAGDYARARPHLEEWWQNADGRIVGAEFVIDRVAALIAVRRAAGDEDNVADLLAAIRDNVRRYREAGIATSADTSPDYEDGLASYLAGDEQPGLELIARAVEDGYFIPPSEAYLQTLYEHPDFAAIRAMQEARQARERERFLAVVCSDNPYAAVWQPAEGTCELFAAEDRN